MDTKLKNRILIILLTVFVIINLLATHNQFYVYFLRPLSMLSISVIAYLMLDEFRPKTTRYKSDVLPWAVIIPLAYLLVYYVLGYFTGFSQNPYNNSMNGILLNTISFGSIIIATEYLRAIIISTSKGKAFTINYIITVILFTVLETNFIINYGDGFEIFKLVSFFFLPLLLENAMLNYVVLKGSLTSSMIYKILIRSFIWVVPIIPNFEWIIEALFSYLVPFFLFLITLQIIDKDNKRLSKADLEATDPKKMIPTFIVVVMLMLFAVGALPYRPVSILSNSMKPSFSTGDIVIVEKIDYNNIIVGDIVQYVRHDFTVIHRVIEVVDNENELPHLITKGDNNVNSDADPVYENQVIGKIKFSVPKLGLPAYWLNNAIKSVDVDIETGKK